MQTTTSGLRFTPRWHLVFIVVTLPVLVALAANALATQNEKPYPWSRPLAQAESDLLVFKDRSGIVRMRIGLIPEKAFSPAIEMCDSKGTTRAVIEVGSDGAPTIQLSAATGGPILILEQADSQMPAIQLLGWNNEKVGEFVKLTLNVLPETGDDLGGRGHIQVVKGQGDVLFETPVK